MRNTYGSLLLFLFGVFLLVGFVFYGAGDTDVDGGVGDGVSMNNEVGGVDVVVRSRGRGLFYKVCLGAVVVLSIAIYKHRGLIALFFRSKNKGHLDGRGGSKVRKEVDRSVSFPVDEGGIPNPYGFGNHGTPAWLHL